jgi:[acyl-carrier-protein] S-malonyltransferase
MEPVQRKLAAEMDTIEWTDPKIPLVSNASGKVVRTAGEVREALIAQIASPVLWADCVRTMAAEGCDHFVELGPGRVLCGLVRQVAPEATASAADSLAKLAPLLEGAAQEA